MDWIIKLNLFIASLILSTQALALDLRISSYNIRNFDYDDRHQVPTNKPLLQSELKALDADLLGVQEIQQVEEFKSFLKSNFSQYNYTFSNCGGVKKQKLGVVYNKYKLKLLSSYEDKRLILTNTSQLDLSTWQ